MVRSFLVFAAGALAACSPSQPVVPDPGVCWRVQAVANQAPRREVLDRDIANLQTCATRLEAVRMMEGQPVEGAFEGRSIFVTETEISQGPSATGPRYPVFDAAQRQEVQAAIRTLLERREAGPAR